VEFFYIQYLANYLKGEMQFCVTAINPFMIPFLLFLLLPLTEPLQSHLIEWSGTRKLNWNDFQGKPKDESDNAALTSSNINFQFGYGSAGFNYSISCRFDKNQSWVKVKSDHVLAHEQGHFDIAEIHARKLNKALKGYKYNRNTVSQDVNKIYEDIMRGHHEMQSVYDRETDHSRNKSKQDEWYKKIANDLKTLEPYADYKK